MPDDRKSPLRPLPGRPGSGPRGIPGPSIREGGGSAPCGCNVAHDEENKLRIYFCPPHAVAYEMLEALQAGLTALDDVANNAPAGFDATAAMEAAMKSRKVLKKAKGNWG